MEQQRTVDIVERRPAEPAPRREAQADRVGDGPATRVDSRPGNLPLFFHATSRPDGTYSITLTEDGLQTFETALGIANDLGGRTRISRRSTIEDIMERTATREELSAVMREPTGSIVRTVRMAVLRCRLWGSEEPSMLSRVIGHLGKLLVVTLILLWAIIQFEVAVSDIAAIPGILAGIPHDILNLHPTSAVTDVGHNISDAGTHVLYAIIGLCLAYIAGIFVKPLRRIYRHDQIIPGERPFMGALAALLRRASQREERATSRR